MVTHSSIFAWRIPKDREAWWATVHSAAKTQIWLKWRRMHMVTSTDFFFFFYFNWFLLLPSSVQLLSHVWLFVTPCQASLSITSSWRLLKLMSIESVMPSNHLILCCPLLPSSIFPSIRVFPMSLFFASGGQSIEVLASASILPMSIQNWFPLGWTGWISLQSKGLSRVFFNTTIQKH